MATTLINLRFHHNGNFRIDEELKFVGGETKVYNKVDIDRFGWFTLKDFVLDLGYASVKRIQWLLLGRNIVDGGLRILNNDMTCQEVIRYLNNGDTIDIFLEGCIPFQFGVCPPDSNFVRDVYLEDVSHVSIYNEEIDFIRDIELDEHGGITENDHAIVGAEDNDEIHVEPEFFENIITDEIINEGGNESMYFDSSDPGSYMWSDEYSSDDGASVVPRRRSSHPRYNDTDECPQWSLGMTFRDPKMFKEAVMKYAALKGVPLKFKKNEPDRVRVVCRAGCPWLLYASSFGHDKSFRIKTYIPEHRCFRENKINVISASYIAKVYKSRIQGQPNIKLRALKDLCKEELKINVTMSKCRRAKMLALEELEGSFKSQYERLYDYAEELRINNPGSTVVVGVTKEEIEGKENSIFKNFYVCFAALKNGWKAGCRPIIGIDGCFLKKMGNCQLLSAIGRDANNQMFPIAWGIVMVESKATWKWFLQLLMNDINSNEGEWLTIISDMQKGLIPAVEELMPLVEHRHCARHIYSNWAKKWKGETLKMQFWVCAHATYEEQFTKALTLLDQMAKGSAGDAINVSPNRWVKAFFSTMPKCDIVDNNLAETFNSWILEPRSKPIITMLDEIRVMMMNRLHRMKRLVQNWVNDIAPRAMTRLENNKVKACDCRVEWNGDRGYEVVCGVYKHVVNIAQCTCSCRACELSGIPCKHAICAIYHYQKNPEDYVSHYYRRDAYLSAYQFYMMPCRGMEMWPRSGFGSINPPKFNAKRGRPKTARRRDADEPRNFGVVSKKGLKQTCSICHSIGHNKKRCSKRSDEHDETNVACKGQRKKKKMEHATQIEQNNSHDTLAITSQNASLVESNVMNTIVESQPTSSQPTSSSTTVNIPTDGWRAFEQREVRWRGAAAITSRRLQERRDIMRQQIGRRNDSSIGSGYEDVVGHTQYSQATND